MRIELKVNTKVKINLLKKLINNSDKLQEHIGS